MSPYIRKRVVRTDTKEWSIACVEGIQDEVTLPRVRHIRQPETCGPGQERAGVRCQRMPRRKPMCEGDQDESQDIHCADPSGGFESDVRQRRSAKGEVDGREADCMTKDYEVAT